MRGHNAESIALLLSKPGRQRARKVASGGWMVCCPAHDDRTPSLSIADGDRGKIVYYCFSGCRYEDIIAAVRAIAGDAPIAPQASAPRIATKAKDPFRPIAPVPDHAVIRPDDFIHSRFGAPKRLWTYNAPDGIRGWIARYERHGRKEIVPWIWAYDREKNIERLVMHSMATPRPLYRLDRIHRDEDSPILIVEGEKAADAGEILFPDWIVTTIPGGSNSVDLADLKPLFGRTVIIAPDHDGPGYNFAGKIVRRLRGKAKLRLLDWPKAWPDGNAYEIREADDCADHIERGWTRNGLRNAVEAGHVLIHRLAHPAETFDVRFYTPEDERRISDQSRR